MKFKEVFLKYQQGKANKNEQEFIEQELEKNKLINEYLAEKLSANYNLEFQQEDNELYNTQKISKRINLKFIYTALSSIIIMALLASLTVFVVLPIYNNAFYNPNEGYQNTNRNTQLYYDMNAFMRLHSPGNITDYASADSLGLGKYEIEISKYNLFTQQWDTLNKTLVRGKFNDGAPLAFYEQPPIGIFYDKGPGSHGIVEKNGTRYKQLASEIVEVKNKLKELPQSAYVSAYISFKQDISINHFMEMKNRFNQLSFNWVAVRHTNSKNFVQLGFTPLPVGYRVAQDIIPKNDFPCYDFRYKEYPDNANTYATHFKTLVKYMSTRKDFLNAFGNCNGLYADNYKRSYDYLKEHGVNSYGVLVAGKAEDIINYINNDFVNSVSVENVKLWDIN
ncbi:anti sigma factor C-terminal domain-containing protein [Clostridium sp. 'deep sea']|uniref:anti sigma factor C-terminal domain-containing protein n=1 Tax=Clostridium sp. 'deep sea' TaxID=2779445 RepID=UPI0018964245|nr:anti sigma factor C-terminal domain-containing protein [Clostridium sp. 'deep sea']QOR35097.1 anti sigma factor C-terminal domain-containing protein [Clostridium sp. 'deep sea']